MDALNCGHKDGYSNAFILSFVAMPCRPGESTGPHAAAGSLHAVSRPPESRLLVHTANPATGWLAWWKSADGELHDYATPIVNGLAIEYGLVEPPEGREYWHELRKKMQDVHFSRLDLGLPCTLVPVRRSDYLQPDGLGMPHKEDGTDTFEDYMNGGISAGHTSTSSWPTMSSENRTKGTRFCKLCLGVRPESDLKMGCGTRPTRELIGLPGMVSPEDTRDTLRTYSCFCRRLSCGSLPCVRGFTARLLKAPASDLLES